MISKPWSTQDAFFSFLRGTISKTGPRSSHFFTTANERHETIDNPGGLPSLTQPTLGITLSAARDMDGNYYRRAFGNGYQDYLDAPPNSKTEKDAARSLLFLLKLSSFVDRSITDRISIMLPVLHKSIQRKHEGLTQALLKARDLNLQDEKGNTLLHLQARQGHLPMVARNGRSKYAIVELQKSHDGFYGVTTALFEKPGYIKDGEKGRELVWSGRNSQEQVGQPEPAVSATVSKTSDQVGSGARAKTNYSQDSTSKNGIPPPIE